MNKESLDKKFPSIAKQWHPIKNNNLTPKDVTHGSERKVWWICDKGHDFEQRIKDRVNTKFGCKICSNESKINTKKEQKIKNNNSIGVLYPHLLDEFHPTRNEDFTLFDVTSGSAKNIWWRCSNNDKHVWETPANKRTKANRGCPYCSGRKVLKEESVGALFPHLLEEWIQKKNIISLFEVTKGSDKKITWECSTCSHVWTTPVKSRVNGSGCPKCSPKKVGRKVTAILQERNGVLATNQPHLIKEWHEHKNGNSTPYNTTSGSSYKAWWVCEKGHEWDATVNSRAVKNTGCPECKKEWKTSFAEQSIYFYMKQIFSEVKNRCKIHLDGKEVEIDVYLPKYKLGIEYDGYHHINRIEQDISKNELLQEYGIKLIRIRECKLPMIDMLDHELIIREKSNLSSLDDSLEKLFIYIETFLEKEIPLSKLEIDCKRDELKILEQFVTEEKKNSLANTHPNVAKQWHPTLNGKLTPLHVKAGSDKTVWWLCDKGHDWDMPICSRTKENGYGCPICSGKRVGTDNSLTVRYPELVKDWSDKNKLKANEVMPGSQSYYIWECQMCSYEWETSPNSRTNKGSGCPNCSKKKVVETRIVNEIKKKGSLADNFPKLVSEWDYSKNRKQPNEYLSYSSENTWWIGRCGHEWDMPISARTNQNQGCPTCGHKKKSETLIKKMVEEGNSLFLKNPTLSTEWHSTENGVLTPQNVTPNSSKKVWWSCSKNEHHVWEARIYDRNRGSGCPYCSGRLVTEENSVKAIYPQLLIQWDYEKNKKLDPSKISISKKVWWKCSEGHSLHQSASGRINKDGVIRNCSQCLNKNKNTH